jgi:anti-sigma-K factor RskA
MTVGRERLEDLLAQRATETLSGDEQSELERLLSAHPDGDSDALDRTAAAIDLAASGAEETLPTRLRRRLERDAAAYFGATPAGGKQGNVVLLRRPAPAWPWLATAAAVLLAVAGWWPASEPPGPTLAEQRAELLEAGALRLDWTVTADPTAAQVSGDVVWSQAEQTGFMLFRGFAANDPGEFQYQLWIFDAERDERYPVDGGVFDVPPGPAEVIVPIRARLPVSEAVLFAVTVEPPGGVVVSSRERIAVLAELG